MASLGKKLCCTERVEVCHLIGQACLPHGSFGNGFLLSSSEGK